MNPRSAVPRPDLTYLRRRSRPAPPPASAVLADFIAGRGRRERAPAAAPSPAESTTAAFQARRPAATAVTRLTTVVPTVLLDRVQSGVGALRMQALGTAAQHARFGCVYRLRSGRSALVRAGRPVQPADPVTVAVRDATPVVTVDLLRARHLDRLIVLVEWDRTPALPATGTLLVTTVGGARIEAEFDAPSAVGATVVLSMANFGGEFVLRAEHHRVVGSPRDAARAHGYDHLTWYDDRTTLE